MAAELENRHVNAQEELADIGVLFVHGIGSQKQGQTLVAFADPVARWFTRWLTRGLRSEPSVGETEDSPVVLSGTELTPSDGPPRCVMTVFEPPEFGRQTPSCKSPNRTKARRGGGPAGSWPSRGGPRRSSRRRRLPYCAGCCSFCPTSRWCSSMRCSVAAFARISTGASALHELRSSLPSSPARCRWRRSGPQPSPACSSPS